MNKIKNKEEQRAMRKQMFEEMEEKLRAVACSLLGDGTISEGEDCKGENMVTEEMI